MGERSVLLSLWMLLFCIMGAISSESSGECGQRDCQRCKTVNSTEEEEEIRTECVKCKHFIVIGSRECVDICPAGYKDEWSTLVDYMGRVCQETVLFGLSGRMLAVIVGTCSGAVLCVCVLSGGYFYFKYRKHRALAKQSSQYSNQIMEQDYDTPERREFLKHLSTMRCEAPIFLAMLNDTRKQVRELYQLNNSNDSAIQAYRPVLLDLARILTLLNRAEENITVPPADWRALFSWGERVLRRYKKQNPHQVAQAQLMNFLQPPVQTITVTTQNHNMEYGSRESLRDFTTFHPARRPLSNGTKDEIKTSNNVSSSGSNQSLQELAISAFNSNYNITSPANNISSDNRLNTISHPSFFDMDYTPSWELHQDFTVLTEWPESREYVDEDGFLMLGRRPQDEITTEL